MQEKTITITIDAQGSPHWIWRALQAQSCEKVFDDFRGGDTVKIERKKASYYTGQQVQQEKSQH